MSKTVAILNNIIAPGHNTQVDPGVIVTDLIIVVNGEFPDVLSSNHPPDETVTKVLDPINLVPDVSLMVPVTPEETTCTATKHLPGDQGVIPEGPETVRSGERIVHRRQRRD